MRTTNPRQHNVSVREEDLIEAIENTRNYATAELIQRLVEMGRADVVADLVLNVKKVKATDVLKHSEEIAKP